MLLALPTILCLASGFALVSVRWSRFAPLTSDLLFRLFLSFGFGLGILSVIFLCARICGITHLLGFDLVVLAVLLVACLLLRVRTVPEVTHSLTIEELAVAPYARSILTAAFTVALCLAAYSSLVRAFAHPHGDGWDAFAIWNLHARFLFLAGPRWRDAFSPLIPWSHPDYPLLLPGAIAHFWTYLGYDSPMVPALISPLFAFGTVGLLCSALSMVRGRTAAMLGGLVLLTTPFFIEQTSSQYADIPVSFFLLATITLLCLRDHQSGNASSSALLVNAGLSAGFAAWTKNEGLLFLFAILIAALVNFISREHRRDSQQHSQTGREGWVMLIPFLAAATPAVLLIVWFKHFLAPPGDLFSGPALHKILDPSRYWAVLKWYIKEFLRFGNWVLIPGTLLLIVVHFVVGTKGRRLAPGGRRTQSGVRLSALALVLTLAGYFVVYLTTPYDIYWHLRFSLNRLLLQLWPSLIFLFFLALGSRRDSLTV